MHCIFKVLWKKLIDLEKNKSLHLHITVDLSGLILLIDDYNLSVIYLNVFLACVLGPDFIGLR